MFIESLTTINKTNVYNTLKLIFQSYRKALVNQKDSMQFSILFSFVKKS